MKTLQFEAPAYIPHLKTRGFNPIPVQGNIPKYADSFSYPKVIGTAAWRSFWDEQIYYCINGYETGGLSIPGIYYHYLNFKIIDGVGGATYPDFIDLHFDIFTTIEELKKDHRPGIVFPKGRRKGLSFVATEEIDHGAKFKNRYRALIAGGESSYVDGFRSKLYRTYNNTVNEMKMNHIRRNDDELILGWKEKTDKGMQELITASIFFKTMKDNPKKGEGEYFNDVILEEFGVFPHGISTINSILPAQRHGDRYLGFTTILGTGGNVLKGSKAFKEVYHNAEAFGFYRFVILGPRYFPPYVHGVKNPETGTKEWETPNLDKEFKDLEEEQLLGCEDVKYAEEKIREGRIERSKNPNKAQLREWNQQFPLSIEEIFASSGSNNFNAEKLYAQAFKIESSPKRYIEIILEFKKDKNGMIMMPLEVETRPPRKGDRDYELIKMIEQPKPWMRDLDIIGIDGYNEDKTETSSSQGAIVVVRRYDKMSGSQQEIDDTPKVIKPIMLYYSRPPRKEKFWEISLKISVFVQAIRNTMISAESDMVIKYYKDNHGRRYLSPRPKSFDAPDSKQMHDFGAKMTTYSKPRMIGVLQTWVEDCVHECWFIEMIYDLIAYDDENIGTDYDSGDALGLSLMRIVDMRRDPTNMENKKKYIDELPDYALSSSGEIIITNLPQDENTGLGDLEDWEKNILSKRNEF